MCTTVYHFVRYKAVVSFGQRSVPLMGIKECVTHLASITVPMLKQICCRPVWELPPNLGSLIGLDII